MNRGRGSDILFPNAMDGAANMMQRPVRAHGNVLIYTVTAERPDRASFTQQADCLHRSYRSQPDNRLERID